VTPAEAAKPTNTKDMNTATSPTELAAVPGSPPEWLEEVVEAIGITDGVDLVKWHQDKTGDYIVEIEYGEEEMSFRAGTDGENHGQDYDGTIFDMTTTDQVQWWCAGELYTRLQRAKRMIEDLEANDPALRARSDS
jgi:hypothetical protein